MTIVWMASVRDFSAGAEWGARRMVEELRKKPYEGSWTEVKLYSQMADYLERIIGEK